MADLYEDFKDALPDWVNEDNFEFYQINHSAEHVFNQAIEELWPGKVKRAIGPAIRDGFYNDSRYGVEISEADFEKIEQKMNDIIKRNLPFVRKDITVEEAKELFKENPFKQELIQEFAEQGLSLTVYYTGLPGKHEFVDLCKGPHVNYTKKIKAFKLLTVAGAYWRGSEKNEMLTRVYGVAFANKEQLAAHLNNLEEAKKRDHRKLGKELDLFLFSDLVGGGLPLWTPRGTVLRNALDAFVWELREAKGYERVSIPHITKRDLYEKSGHWAKFSDELMKINTREGHEFAMKPMNCPHHTQIFDHLPRSYKDMPQRYAETTMVYRDEQSGELSGLSRVRCITQDDAHVFCREVQLKEEFFAIWDIVNSFYSTFGFELKVRLSFHDPANFDAYLGTPEIWAKAENVLEEIAKERKAVYYIGRGEAAMYGPKIDFITNDSLGREWQVATIQLDMNMPERFDLNCINESGQKERIIMLHAAIMGSIERFSSVMIEHFGGAFPTWLAPEQVRIIPITSENIPYAQKLAEQLKAEKVRVTVDLDNERMQKKIFAAQQMKVPFMVILGQKEQETDTLSFRTRSGGETNNISVDKFITGILSNISQKSLDFEI